MRYVRIGDVGPSFQLKTEILENVIPEVTNIAVLNTGGNFHFLFFTKSEGPNLYLVFCHCHSHSRNAYQQCLPSSSVQTYRINIAKAL